MSVRDWFGRRVDGPRPAADASGKLEAYRDGRRDEQVRVERDIDTPTRATKAELDAAHDRGQLDERRRHRSSPLVGLIVLILVVIGAGMIYLTARNGSVGKAGEVVDQNVSAAAQNVGAPVRGAADKVGTALQNTGETIKDRAGSGQP